MNIFILHNIQGMSEKNQWRRREEEKEKDNEKKYVRSIEYLNEQNDT